MMLQFSEPLVVVLIWGGIVLTGIGGVALLALWWHDHRNGKIW